MKSVTLLGKEIPTAVLALVLVLAGVGATAGAAASGDIAGDGTTNVDQALLLNDTTDAVTIVDGDGTVQIADDRTAFTFATDVFQGSSQTVDVSVDNQASDGINARLVADVEEPLRVEVTSNDDNLSVTRVSPNEFIVNATGDVEDDNFEITVHAPNDANPDFYEFEFQLEPVDVSDEVRSDQ